METRLKRFLSLALAIMMVFSMMPQITLGAQAASLNTLYLKPNSNWTQSNAWFAIYGWSSSSTAWTGMTDSDGDGIYEGKISSDCTNIIFCRMNSSATDTGWANVWNQTSDLTYDGTNNMYTVADGAWSKGSGSWSVYTYVEPTYTVAGQLSLCGTDWDVTNTANDMTKSGSKWVKVYENVPAGTYEFKVVRNHSWTDASWPSGNASVTAAYTLNTVTITFDGSNVSATAACAHANTTTTTVDATCAQDGRTVVTCDACYEVVSTETLTATGHSWINNDGVCANGCGTKCEHDDGNEPAIICLGDQCGICGYVLSAGGHSWINQDGVCANDCGTECEHEGMTDADEVCGTCGKTNPDYEAPETYVAQIGETKYETLKAALNDAVSGDTITVLQTVEITEDLTINVPGVTVETPTGVYLRHNGGKLEIQNGIFNAYFSGTASGDHSVSISGGTFNSDNYFGGSISISGGTFAKGVVASTGATKMDITGGTFNNTVIFGSVTTTISGGTFNGVNGGLGGSSSACTITGGTFKTALTSGYVNCIAAGYEQVQNDDGTYSVVKTAAAASTISNEEELIEALAAGGEYTLAADITLTDSRYASADTTLNLGDYKITGGYWELSDGVTGSSLTINGGSIEQLCLVSKGKLSLNGTTVTGGGSQILAVLGNTTISNSVLRDTNDYVSSFASVAATLTLNACTVTDVEFTLTNANAKIVLGADTTGVTSNTVVLHSSLESDYDLNYDEDTMTYSVVKTAAASPAGTIGAGFVTKKSDNSRYYVYMEIADLYATESVVVKLFSDDTLMATTTLMNEDYFEMTSLGVNIVISGDASSSWSTVWEDGHPIYNVVPNKAVLYVDGTEMNSAVVTVQNADKTSPYTDWADVPGVYTPPMGNNFTGYTSESTIWGETWGNAKESFVVKVLDANDNVMGTTSLNNIDGIIDGDVYVTWNIKLDAASNTDEYWTMSWTTAPSLTNVPAKVELWVDGEKVSGGNVVLNGPDDLNKIYAAEVDENGTILGYYTSLEAAVAATDNVAILRAGSYSMPTGKNLTITGAVDGVVFECGQNNIGMGEASVTFNNVTFEWAANGWPYHGLAHCGDMVYNNCIFNGTVFLYGTSETFNKCTFNVTGDTYNVWTYGAKEVEFNGCTFYSEGKSVLIYSEDSTLVNEVAVTDCDFIASAAVDGKAAIEMDSSLTAGIKLTIDEATTATGFGTGNESGNSLWNNKKGSEGANNDITVTVGDEVVLAPAYAQIGATKYASLEAAVAEATTGDEIILLDNVTIAAGTDVTIPDGVTLNGNGFAINAADSSDDWGYIIAGGALTIKGETKVEKFSASYYNHVITIGAGASLNVFGSKRVTLAYGNTFNITGSIAEAKTADKATVQPSLIIPAGISITGGSDATMNVTNAYVQIGSTTSKNSAANGKFTLNFTNAIAEFTNQLTFSEPTSGKTPTFELNIKDSVLTTGTKLIVAAPNSTTVIDNSVVTLGNYLRNSGNMTLKNGSVLTGSMIQFGENGGNDGTITVDASTLTVNITSTGHAMDGKETGKLIVVNGGSANVGYITDSAITVDTESSFTTSQVLGTSSVVVDATNYDGTSALNIDLGATDTSAVAVSANNDYRATVTDGKVSLTKIVYVAQIGDTKYESLPDAIAKAVDGDTITLLADCAEDVTVVQASNYAITIDGDGKTMSGTITVNGKSARYATTALTIKNVNFDATNISKDASINLGVKGDSNTRYTSNVTVENCTFAGTGNAKVGIKQYTGGCHNLVVTGCTATGMHSLMQLQNVEKGLTVSDVKITDGKNGISIGNSNNAAISGCEINVTGYGVRADGDVEAALAISDMTITANQPIVVRKTTATYDLTVSGNNTLTAAEGFAGVTFTSTDDGVEPAAPTVAVKADIADGVTVFPVYQAKIGDLSYVTLEAAIAAAVDGNTVTLLTDVELSKYLDIYTANNGEVAREITLDLNGKTVSPADDYKVSDYAFVFVGLNQTLNITGTGTVTAAGGVTVGVYGVLNLQSGTVANTGTGEDDLAIHIYNWEGGDGYAGTAAGTGYITGGTVNGGVYTEGDGKLVISGGIFDEPVAEEYCAEGYIPTKNEDGTYGVKVGKFVAKIGETKYESLQAAINEAVDGDTITLLTDITEDVTVNKSVTIDGAGKNYTGGITVEKASTAAVTVKNVNFIGGANYAITTNTIKSITVENCTATGYNYGFLYANRSTPTVVVKDVEVSNVNYGFHWVYGSTATLENVKMTNVAYGIMVQNYAGKTITMKGCEISGTNPIYIWERANVTGVQTFNFVGANTLTDTNDETAISTYAKLVLTEDTATLTAPAGLTVESGVEGMDVIYANGVYYLAVAVAQINDTKYDSFEAALNAVQDGETITLIDVEGSELSKEIDFTKDISFTITGSAPEYALPVVTFQNATVTIKDAEILIPELDARQNATINVVDSIVHDAGGNGIVKSYYNGAINISGTSVVYTMQVTTMGYITVSDTAKLNATWQTNVYGNGLITVKDGATFATAALHLTGKDYSGRDNTDADRVGKPATIVVDGANFIVGSVKSDNGADYSYNSSKGINIGTIDGKSAVLDVKNGAKIEIYMADGETANIGADGTIKIDGSGFTLACRKADGAVTLANSGNVLVSGASDIAATVTGDGWVYMNGVTLDADTKLYGAKVGFINGTNNVVGSVIDDGWFSVGIGQNAAATAAAAFAEANGITMGDVTVNVSDDAVIGAGGATYAGWIGSAYSADKTTNKYVLNVENSLATFGYLHISKDGELNVKGHATNKYTYDNANVDFYAGDFIINGVATLDGTDAWAKFTKISVDHVDGVLNIVNGTNYEASIHNGSTTGNALKFWLAGKFNVDAASKVEIDNATVLVEGAELNIGGAVIAKGTVTGDGTITLTDEAATYTAAENLNVDTDVEESKVIYEEGTYKVVPMSYGEAARIGDDYYETVEEAIAAAQPGDTVVLVDNVETDVLALLKGITLDLNGYTVNATGYVAIFDGNHIIDSVGGGLLKTPRIMVHKDNAALPIWDDTNKGYVLADLNGFDETESTSAANSLKYYFLPYLEGSDYELLAKGAEVSGVTMKVKVTWTSANGLPTEATFVYTDDLMQQFFSYYDAATDSFGKAFTLSLSGTDKVTDLAFQVFFVSETGAVLTCN